MEMESNAKDPLLFRGPELQLESANSYEDSIPVYHQFSPNDPFSFESLMLCSCIQLRIFFPNQTSNVLRDSAPFARSRFPLTRTLTVEC